MDRRGMLQACAGVLSCSGVPGTVKASHSCGQPLLISVSTDAVLDTKQEATIRQRLGEIESKIGAPVVLLHSGLML